MCEFLSVKQVAERYGRSEETVKRWLRKGNRFPNAVKHSDKEGWRIPVTDIEKEKSVPLVQKKSNIQASVENSDYSVDCVKELVSLAYQVGTMTRPSEELVNILSCVGFKRTLELLLVLRQSPTRVKNPTAFLKKAISEGWTPETIPQKVERRQVVRRSYRSESLPEWFNKTNEVEESTLESEILTDKLLETYNLLRELSEMGNRSAKEKLSSIEIELEKRGFLM